jgi:membrane-bound lytic murein transglycosylase D
VDLRRVAEWTDTTIDEIQALNPELRRWTTPMRAEQYELKVPEGTGEQVQARLDESSSADLASLKFYTVKRGDTLPLIARKLSVSKADLAEANYLPATARVAAGQKLIVPHETTVLMAARTTRTVPVAEARALPVEPVALARATTSNRIKVTYKVKRGDTLASIARLFRTTVSALRTWNPRLPSSHLAAGARLTVYTARDARTNE